MLEELHPSFNTMIQVMQPSLNKMKEEACLENWGNSNGSLSMIEVWLYATGLTIVIAPIVTIVQEIILFADALVFLIQRKNYEYITFVTSLVLNIMFNFYQVFLLISNVLLGISPWVEIVQILINSSEFFPYVIITQIIGPMDTNNVTLGNVPLLLGAFLKIVISVNQANRHYKFFDQYCGDSFFQYAVQFMDALALSVLPFIPIYFLWQLQATYFFEKFNISLR